MSSRYQLSILAAAAVAIGIGIAMPARADGVLEGAKKEGKLVIYTGVERAAAQVLVDAFAKKYPFIAAETVRASSSKLATRLDAEIEANRVQCDLFEFSLLYLTTSSCSSAESFCNTIRRNTRATRGSMPRRDIGPRAG